MVRIIGGPFVQFDVGLDADGKIRVAVWDRFTTWGFKKKGDQESDFNEVTLGQMVDNWRARGGRLTMCQDHKSAAAPMVSAPALAYFDALAVVRGGQVLRFEKLGESLATPPDPLELKSKVARFAAPGNEDPEPDGLWGFRSEVTPLGEDPREGLRNYLGISPMFKPNGKDEQGNEIGYVLYDVAATNTAFQAGCELTLAAMAMSREAQGVSRPERTQMDEAMLKKLSLSAEASDEDKKSALKKFAAECASKMSELEGEEAGKMADDLEAASAYAEGGEAEGMKKLAAKFRRFAAPAEEPKKESTEMAAKPDADGDKDGDKAKEMAAFAQSLGIDPKGKNGAQLMDAIKAATVPAAKIPELVKMSVATAMAEEKAAAKAIENKQRAAVLMSALPKEYPGDRAALERLAQRDPDEAEKLARPFLPKTDAPTHLFGRLTSQGAPIGKGNDAREMSDGKPKNKVVKTPLGRFTEDDTHFAAEIERVAKATDSETKAKVDRHLSEKEQTVYFNRLVAAKRVLIEERPELAEDFGD